MHSYDTIKNGDCDTSQLHTVSAYSPPTHCPTFAQWSFPSNSCDDPEITSEFAPSFHNHVPLAKLIRGVDRHASLAPGGVRSISSNTCSSLGRDREAQSLPPIPRIPSVQPIARVHIPRPPNAFMLFRSDFLKKGVIPTHVERRQQNLSRIAGQCWNLLSAEEKGKWQDQAAKVLLDHQKRNPDYKFTPAPRGSRRSKGKARVDIEPAFRDGEDRIRQIREEYTHIAGPSATPSRRRRTGSRTKPTRNTPTRHASLSPLSSSASSPNPVLPSPGYFVDSPALPPFFPQYTVPHVVTPRRPSTSLGFSTSSTPSNSVSPQAGHGLHRPLSAASSDTGLSSYLHDLDITPTATTFGNISNILPAKNPSDPEQDFPDVIRDALPFSALNGPESPHLSSAVLPLSQGLDNYIVDNSGSLLNSLYSNNLSPLFPSCDSEGHAIFEHNYYFPNMLSSLSEWDFTSSHSEAFQGYAPF